MVPKGTAFPPSWKGFSHHIEGRVGIFSVLAVGDISGYLALTIRHMAGKSGSNHSATFR